MPILDHVCPEGMGCGAGSYNSGNKYLTPCFPGSYAVS